MRRLEAATAGVRALATAWQPPGNRQLRDALEHALGEQRAAAILTPAASRPETRCRKNPAGDQGTGRKTP
jgi:hypothetical protein